MSTFSSKQQKSQGLVDMLLILASIAVISLLVLLGSRADTLYDSFERVHETQGFVNAGVSNNPVVSFASDEQYWNANCSHGWGSNSKCDDIVSRAQSCEIGYGSNYCSEYETYMQEFLNQ